MSEKLLTLQLEILTASFYEHFKFSEDLAKYLQPTHPKRINLQKELNNMVEEMNSLREKIKMVET
jgi:hypothetical protein